MILRTILLAFICLHLASAAQNGNYIVKLSGDTLRNKIKGFKPHKGKVKATVNGQTVKFKAEQLSAAYCDGLMYEAVKPVDKKRWYFMIKEFSGDVTVYRRLFQKSYKNGNNKNVEKFYFRQKNQQRAYVMYLNKKNVKSVSSYSCKAVMDSLIQKMDWTTYLTEMLRQYNDRCTINKDPR